MPEPLLEFLDNIPGALLVSVLLTPFMVLLGAIINGLVMRRGHKLSNKVGEHEAKTHEFSAIVDGFETLLTQQKNELSELRNRVDKLESYQRDLIEHVDILEALIPSPPGPPPRPHWLQAKIL